MVRKSHGTDLFMMVVVACSWDCSDCDLPRSRERGEPRAGHSLRRPTPSDLLPPAGRHFVKSLSPKECRQLRSKPSKYESEGTCHKTITTYVIERPLSQWHGPFISGSAWCGTTMTYPTILVLLGTCFVWSTCHNKQCIINSLEWVVLFTWASWEWDSLTEAGDLPRFLCKDAVFCVSAYVPVENRYISLF